MSSWSPQQTGLDDLLGCLRLAEAGDSDTQRAVLQVRNGIHDTWNSSSSVTFMLEYFSLPAGNTLSPAYGFLYSHT